MLLVRAFQEKQWRRKKLYIGNSRVDSGDAEIEKRREGECWGSCVHDDLPFVVTIIPPILSFFSLS